MRRVYTVLIATLSLLAFVGAPSVAATSAPDRGPTPGAGGGGSGPSWTAVGFCTPTPFGHVCVNCTPVTSCIPPLPSPDPSADVDADPTDGDVLVIIDGDLLFAWSKVFAEYDEDTSDDEVLARAFTANAFCKGDVAVTGNTSQVNASEVDTSVCGQSP